MNRREPHTYTAWALPDTPASEADWPRHHATGDPIPRRVGVWRLSSPEDVRPKVREALRGLPPGTRVEAYGPPSQRGLRTICIERSGA